MKSFADYWEAMTVRNPTLADPDAKVTITSDNFKRALQQAFIEGGKSDAGRAGLFDELFPAKK